MDRITGTMMHDIQVFDQHPGIVNTADYLKKIISDFRKSHYTDRPILYEIDIENSGTPVEFTVPIGLVLLELLTNTFDHALADAPFPRIRINLCRENSQWKFIYSDNGSGLPLTIEPGDKRSVGMQMLGIFLRHLKANYVINRVKGTEFIIRWNQ